MGAVAFCSAVAAVADPAMLIFRTCGDHMIYILFEIGISGYFNALLS
jgi:hypothetical protein